MTVYYARRPVVVDVALRGDRAACRASLNRETARLAGRAARLVVDLDAVDEVDSQLLAARSSSRSSGSSATAATS